MQPEPSQSRVCVCDSQNNVERKHAIHEHRLASVKASLSLSTPRRMEFMDKRLSKNFHTRRHHEQVVHENLKLLRALEEIHSRSSTAGAEVPVGVRGGVASGGDGGLGGSPTAPASHKRRKGVLSSSAGRSGSRKKLSSLLARKRNVKAAMVARENQKMMEVSATHFAIQAHQRYNYNAQSELSVCLRFVLDCLYFLHIPLSFFYSSKPLEPPDTNAVGATIAFLVQNPPIDKRPTFPLNPARFARQRMTRSKSLYSREKMRQHRVRHQRVLRLRKTDYTAGHLLAAATANRHWGGGSSRDEGFSYSFEEGRYSSHTHRQRKASARTSPSSGTSRTSRRSSTAARGTSYSPSRSPNSISVSTGIGGGRTGGGRGTRSAPRLPSLLDVDDIYGGGSILGSPNLEQCLQAAEMSARSGGGGGGGGSGSRPSSSKNTVAGSGNHEDETSRLRPSTDSSGIGSRGGSRQNRKSSRHCRGGKDATGGSGSSTGGVRGTDASVDSLSHRGGFPGSGEDSPGGTRGGRYSSRRSKGGGGGRGEKSARSSVSDGNTGNDADLDRIFNPLAFLDEEQGVRVLIQATKPLEVRFGTRTSF